MSAIVKACFVANTIQNTGKECDVSMAATAMLIAVPKSLTFDDTDLEDPVQWLNGLLHAAKPQRAYIVFGQQAPIRALTNNKENDVLVTLDDGSTVFLRYGFFNRMFETTSGGLDYAKKLQSLNKSGYSIIEIDNEGKMLVHDNGDGTYSGFVNDLMYSPSPILADFKSTPYKNQFYLSYSPKEIVQNGLILAGANQLLALQGLIDAKIVSKAAGTTGTLTIGVETLLAETDLVALFGSALANVANFVVTEVDNGTVVVPTSAAIVGGNIVLSKAAGFTSGKSYSVAGAAPSVWLAALIDGYDASQNPTVITIP